MTFVVENFNLAKQLKQSIETLKTMAGEVGGMVLSKKQAVANEDYDTASALKVQFEVDQCPVFPFQFNSAALFIFYRHALINFGFTRFEVFLIILVEILKKSNNWFLQVNKKMHARSVIVVNKWKPKVKRRIICHQSDLCLLQRESLIWKKNQPLILFHKRNFVSLNTVTLDFVWTSVINVILHVVLLIIVDSDPDSRPLPVHKNKKADPWSEFPEEPPKKKPDNNNVAYPQNTITLKR